MAAGVPEFTFHVFTRFQVSGAALNSMLESPDGPVGFSLLERAVRIQAYAKAHCPVEAPESAARRHREPGRLRDDIQVRRPEEATNALFFQIGSTLPYARRIEFNPRVGGFLRGALAAEVGAEGISGPGAL